MGSNWFLKVIYFLMKKISQWLNKQKHKDPVYEWNFLHGHSYVIIIFSGKLEMLIFVKENL